MDDKLLKISSISKIENSYITILAKYKNDISKYGIVYTDPVENKLIQLFNDKFAFLYKNLVSDFTLGLTVGAIVGLARERTPADQWYSDTIERSYEDKNSMHQGILRIINKEDGIPVFIKSTQVIGNIAPALAYFFRGNPVEVRQALTRYNLIQKTIMAKILEGKPPIQYEPPMNYGRLAASYCPGDGYKATNRQSAISAALNNLTPLKNSHSPLPSK